MKSKVRFEPPDAFERLVHDVAVFHAGDVQTVHDVDVFEAAGTGDRNPARRLEERAGSLQHQIAERQVQRNVLHVVFVDRHAESRAADVDRRRPR